MARRHRILFPGAVYHVMARGNRKQAIFTDAKDRRRFLTILAAGVQRFDAACYAYCLMGNHFHLVLRTPHANVPRVMHHVDGLYARYVNWRHRLTGRLFEAPYAAILIDDTCYLRNAIAYVLRNPVEAGLTTAPEHWPWSSYNATMGRTAEDWLTLNWLPSLFEGRTLDECRATLDEYVRGEQSSYVDLVRAVAEGSSDFKKRVRRVVGASLYRAELPASYRSLGRPSLSNLFADTRRADRRAAILRAHVVHGYLLVDIANFLELHPTTISRIVNQAGSYRLIRD